MFDSFKRFSFLTELLISLERCDTYTKIEQEKLKLSQANQSLTLAKQTLQSQFDELTRTYNSIKAHDNQSTKPQ